MFLSFIFLSVSYCQYVFKISESNPFQSYPYTHISKDMLKEYKNKFRDVIFLEFLLGDVII